MWSNLQEALKRRELMAQAKRVLMRWSECSEAQALQRIDQYGGSTGTGLPAIASRIVKADELLFREPTLADCLRVILRTVGQTTGLLPIGAAEGLSPHRFPGGWRKRSAISWEG